VAIPPLPELIALVEGLAALGRPDGLRPRVRAIALNTAALTADAARQTLDQTAVLTGLPCQDPVRAGGEELLLALFGQGADTSKQP
jgi:uncharacterized NAD-dependent epimerase/dehydratase family protein